MPTSTAAPPRPALLTHVRATSASVADAVAARDRHIVAALRGGQSIAAVARAANLDPGTIRRILERATS